MIAWLLALAWCSGSADAHVYPIHPARVDLRQERGNLRVQFEVDAVWWDNETLHAEPPPRNWPPQVMSAMQDYVNKDLVLMADGKRLAGRLEECRMIHEPWESMLKLGAWGKEGLIRCRLSYPLSFEPQVLSGKMQFHVEEWLEQKGKEINVPWPREFWNILRFPGKTLRVPVEKPGFSVLGSETKRTSLQAARECLWAVPKGSSTVPLALFAASLALWGFSERGKPGASLTAAGAALAVWFAAAPVSPPWFANNAAWLAAGAVAALFLIDRPVPPLYLACFAAAVAPVLGDASSAWDATEDLLAQKAGLMAGSLGWLALAYVAAGVILELDMRRQAIPSNLSYMAGDIARLRRRQAAQAVSALTILHFIIYLKYLL